MSYNPNTVKSQDDTTEDELGRTMTLLQAIEQLEKTECKLERVEKQLEIAKSYLNVIKCLRNGKCLQCVDFAYRALRKIKELNK